MTAAPMHRVPTEEIFVPFSTAAPSTPELFIREADGRPVLDSDGKKVPSKKWKAVSHGQKERFDRMQAALAGKSAKWLQTQNVTPQRLCVPEASLHEASTGFKGRGFGQNAKQASNFLETLRARAWAAGSISAEVPEHSTYDLAPVSDEILAKRSALARALQLPKDRSVDGFVLLEGAGVDLPEGARRSCISGGGYSAVVQSDMNYFRKLAELDAGDNSLPFDAFCTLPRLQELRLQCNHIATIPILPKSAAYPALERLDLSYNSLGLEAVAALAQLSNLRSLDLTCNGLTALPYDMAKLYSLEKLVLERNQLEGCEVLAVLATLPALRDLGLAFNYFAAVDFVLADNAATPSDQQQLLQSHLPTEAVTPVPPPPAAAAAATAVVPFSALDTLDLAFNYIARESDALPLINMPKLARVLLYGNPICGPTGEDTLGLCVDELLVAADAARDGWGLPPLDVVTEMPRQPKERAQMRYSRRRPYSDACVTLLVEGAVPKASAFKAAGNQAVFQFEAAKGSTTADIASSTLAAVAAHRAAESKQRHEDLTFLTSLDLTESDVMQRHQNDPSSTGEEASHWFDEEGAGLGADQGLAALLKRPVDRSDRGDPAKLRVAIAALRCALRRPPAAANCILTSAGDSVTRGSLQDVGRHNAAYRSRELPRRPYEIRRMRDDRTAAAAAAAAAGTTVGSLAHMEQVLQSMNDGMAAVALERRVIASAGVGQQWRGSSSRADQQQGPGVMSSSRSCSRSRLGEGVVGTNSGAAAGMSSLIKMVNAVMDEMDY